MGQAIGPRTVSNHLHVYAGPKQSQNVIENESL